MSGNTWNFTRHNNKDMRILLHSSSLLKVNINNTFPIFQKMLSKLETLQTMHKKWSFPLKIPSVNVTKPIGNCRFGHIYWRNP